LKLRLELPYEFLERSSKFLRILELGHRDLPHFACRCLLSPSRRLENTILRGGGRSPPPCPEPLLARRQLCLHVGANSDRGDYPLLHDDVHPAVAPRDGFAHEGPRFPASEGSASIRCREPGIERDVRSQLSRCQPCGDFEIGWDHEDFARLLVLVERAEPRFEPRFPRGGFFF